MVVIEKDSRIQGFQDSGEMLKEPIFNKENKQYTPKSIGSLSLIAVFLVLTSTDWSLPS